MAEAEPYTYDAELALPPAREDLPQDPVRRDPAAVYDALGRKQPTRLGFIQIARVFPDLAAQFITRVPDQFTATVATGVVQVSCPCGAAPELEWNVPEPCACERMYLNFGGGVRVAYTRETEDDPCPEKN